MKHYGDAVTRIESAAEKISRNQLLSENECIQLKKDIIGLPGKSGTDAQGGYTEMSIDDLLTEFYAYADESKEQLESMLSIVSDGRVPSTEERKSFDRVINLLTQKYESVCSYARNQLPEQEMPAAGSPVSFYSDAIINSRAAALQKQISATKDILEKFTSVQSLVESYSTALAPFQTEAKELLRKIEKNEVSDVTALSDEIEGPQLFLRALACEDTDSDESNELLDSLEEYYPSRVTRGLSKQSYFLPEKAKITDNNTGKKPQPESEAVFKPGADVTPTTKDMPASKLKEAPKDEHCEFTKRMIEQALFYDDKKDLGILSSDISAGEGKKISASVFLNDLRKGNIRVLKNIIQQVAHFPLISPRILDLRYGMPANIAESSLDFLKSKGYLRKYRVLPGGEFYCSSPRLEKSLTYKEASKFVGVRQLSTDSMGELIEDKVSSAAARMAFLNLYVNSAANYIASDVKECSISNTLFTEAFSYKSSDADIPGAIEIIAGAFWTDSNECDEFIESILAIFSDADTVERFVFASADNVTGKKIIAEILRYCGKTIDTSNVYIYVLSEGAFYSYKDNSKVSKEAVWKGLAEKKELEATDETEEPIIDKETDSGSEKSVNNDSVNLETDPIGAGEQMKKGQKEIQLNKSLTAAAEKVEKSDSDNVEDVVYKLINANKFYCVPAYVKARSLKDGALNTLYDQIAYALNDPMRHCTYSADGAFDLIPQHHSSLSDALVISIGLRTFFSNQVRYDYNIKALYNALKEYPVLSQYPSLSNVLYKLVEFKDEHKKGMDAYADYRAKSISQLENELKKIQRDAKTFYESIIIGKKVEKASQRRFLETKKLIFDPHGDIGQYVKVVVDNDKDIQPLMIDFLQENFIRDGNVVSEDTIDADMLWAFILKYWDQAGERMMMTLRADLMSRLRSNIISSTTKAVQIMIRWCNVVDKLNDRTEDAGSAAYKKIRNPLITDIDETLESMAEDIVSDTVTDEDKAGLGVIRYTLDEVGRCLKGVFDENERRFFYAQFLFSDDIMLDESFCPDLDVRSSELAELQPDYRILEHAGKKLMTPDERLSEILRDDGDDYGTARLLVEYMEAMGIADDMSAIKRDIEDGEVYAKETADLRKEQFIGDLELAQSYGQIDNADSSEDKKEKILQIVDEWYENSVETSNYGFFKRIMDSYIIEIRKESKSREKDLLEQLEAFKDTSIKGISSEAKQKKIARIYTAIEQQNYTVAEDLLARASQIDEEHEEIIEGKFLREFLEDYDDYYKPVAQSQTSFATLVSSRTRNKEERGGKRLADNWLPGGSNLGKDRLVSLLSGFGFKVDSNSVQAQGPIGRFENFLVHTLAAQGGKRENYTHPIAAFGSGASQEGFRVVCLNGKYDAASLIDVMKHIGNAKHTMILLDFALDMPERRILARKSKSELGDRLFVVVDRTVMMYMVRNYDETKANRMLMSLITPFGYYQPYVWESSNVMPPEIFMGRKLELERIESPTGANIVYGGRQLGKSALLKKAKADIDGDENGDRVVLVDIKGLNYKEAAKKIGHALYDESVLKEDISTTDWDDLARVMKKRLQTEKDRIPYLLLLLDEADVFIESCKEVNYRPFDSLKEVQNIGVGRFKFVIAGLRNVVRFQRDAALGNNSVLTHLEAMTVKPFKVTEARELMEIPLHYLGLEFPKEKESLITLILASTNYFPGLIQLYCAKLLLAMRKKDYAGYNETDTPIYEISEKHIKKVLADPEFMEQIREKYIITLKLDEDNYYYLIALIMAFLYHNNGYNDGYSAEDIKNAGKELGIAKIARLDDEKLSAFMEELKELNVLRSTDSAHYLFTRFTFFQMMGTRNEVDDKLEEYMED